MWKIIGSRPFFFITAYAIAIVASIVLGFSLGWWRLLFR